MSWNPIDDPIDHFVLSGQKSPGVAEITGLGSPRKWDEQKSHGSSGGGLVFGGDAIVNFSAKIYLTTREDWNDWHAFAPLVERSPDKKPSALDIWHPQTEMKNIKAVVVEDCLGPNRDGDDGRWVVEIKFKQYRPAKPAMAKPKGSQNNSKGSGGSKGNPEEDERDKLIRELSQQVKDLA